MIKDFSIPPPRTLRPNHHLRYYRIILSEAVLFSHASWILSYLTLQISVSAGSSPKVRNARLHLFRPDRDHILYIKISMVSLCLASQSENHFNRTRDSAWKHQKVEFVFSYISDFTPGAIE